MFGVREPERLTLERDAWEFGLALDAFDAEVTEPGLLRDLRERRVQAIDMHRFVTHITDYDLIFFIVTIADSAFFAL